MTKSLEADEALETHRTHIEKLLELQLEALNRMNVHLDAIVELLRAKSDEQIKAPAKSGVTLEDLGF